MINEWVNVTLKSLTLKIGSGSTPRGGANVYTPVGSGFIRSQNIYDGKFEFNGLARLSKEAAHELRNVAVIKEDVLINITGDSVTRTCIVPLEVLPAYVSQHVAIIRPDSNLIDPRFLSYLLLSPEVKQKLDQFSQAGATRKALTKAHLENLVVCIPKIQTQRRIAKTLGSIDDLIQTNQALLTKLEELARQIAYSVDLLVPLRELAFDSEVVSVPPVGMTDHYSLPAFDDERRPQRVEGSQIKSNKLIIRNPSVLIARLNPHIPRVWMVYPVSNILSAASTEFVPVEGNLISSEEVWTLCSHERFISQMNSLVTGTTGSHQRVDKRAILDLRVPNLLKLSPEKRRTIQTLIQESYRAQGEVRSLQVTRDELLPLLFSGVITVKEVAA